MTKKFAFTKDERLKKKKDFEKLIKKGKTINVFPFHCKFYISDNNQKNMLFKVAVAVKKKVFKKATQRNTIKRRTRESIRLNATELKNIQTSQNKNIFILMVYNHNNILIYKDIEQKIKEIFNIIINKYFV